MDVPRTVPIWVRICDGCGSIDDAERWGNPHDAIEATDPIQTWRCRCGAPDFSMVELTSDEYLGALRRRQDPSARWEPITRDFTIWTGRHSRPAPDNEGTDGPFR